MSTLLDAVRRHAEAQADKAGVARTPIADLTTMRATTPSGLVHAICRPLACLVLQGRKRVTMGAQAFSLVQATRS
jgi:AraC-type transcriptional regulator N-terminus